MQQSEFDTPPASVPRVAAQPGSPESELAPRPSLAARLLRSLRHTSLLLGLILGAVILVLIAGASRLTSYDPVTQDPAAVFGRPSIQHLMGTDAFGRDLFARVLFGGRNTVLASIFVVLLGAPVGSVLGLVAGYFRGLPSVVIMRFMDLLLAFPGILLALAVAAILGPGLTNGVIAVALVSVPAYARVVEGATLEVRGLPYVDAAVTVGASSLHIIWRHVLPNVLPGIAVLATSWLGIGALWIAALGFLGLGVQPPLPEWGAILNDGQTYITVAWWISFFPGIFLALYAVGVNLIGDGLRDQLDPTLARR
jgi:ABC-type dipeptide/oligopeptide/nickel transport system permease subunit